MMCFILFATASRLALVLWVLGAFTLGVKQ
jgi:hypothetical protein